MTEPPTDDAILALRERTTAATRVHPDGYLEGPGGTVLVDGHDPTHPDPTRWVDRRSPFGNPFVGVDDGGEYAVTEACDLYEGWFRGCLETEYGPFDRADVLALRGEVLACHCVPERCHGETILAWLADRHDPQRTLDEIGDE